MRWFGCKSRRLEIEMVPTRGLTNHSYQREASSDRRSMGVSPDSFRHQKGAALALKATKEALVMVVETAHPAEMW